MLLNTILLALRSIRRNLMRSFLTVLGIVIGVSAVITMVTLGNGATQAVQTQISSLGTNLLQIRPGQRMGPGAGGGAAPSFKEADATAIASQIGGVSAVAPESRSSATVVANGRNWTSSVVGSSNAWLTTGNWLLQEGREFSDDELRAGAASCIIGETVRREMFGSTPALGQALRVKQVSCEVVGILASKGQGSFGNDQDDVVLVPLKTLQRRITGNTRVNTLLVSMAEGSDATLSGTTQIMTTLLGAVAAVSLLVGGIGVMNIMLVSVTERTREIGLRLAIGALEREVLLQFLIEAVVLASLGGLLGVALATVASLGLAALMQIPYSFNLGVNLMSFAFSAAIGVVFGFVPARRAARLDPIEALRHE